MFVCTPNTLFCYSSLSSGYLKAKQFMDEENYDKIISECSKEVESGGRHTAEALLLRATFYLLIGNASAAQPDLDQVINMESANVKVGTRGVWGACVLIQPMAVSACPPPFGG